MILAIIFSFMFFSGFDIRLMLALSNEFESVFFFVVVCFLKEFEKDWYSFCEYLVEVSSEAIRLWTLVYWMVFNYQFNFVASNYFVCHQKMNFPGGYVPNMLLKKNEETATERMKRLSQNETNAQLWM